MIPSAFKFYKPENLEKAVSIMEDYGDEARVIAGGHSLIPVMKQRLTDIKHLIDLSAIKELKGISIKDNLISIGAMTTQVELITNEEISSGRFLSKEELAEYWKNKGNNLF